MRSSSIYTIITNTLTETLVGATPLPSVKVLPTLSVYDLDESDPKGWTYCYAYVRGTQVEEDFLSYFPDDELFNQAYHNCSSRGTAVSPVIDVEMASFLLDETTSYVDNPKTEHSEISRSRTSEPSQTPTDVLIDPIQIPTKSPSAQRSSSSGQTSERSETSPTTTALAQSKTPSTDQCSASDETSVTGTTVTNPAHPEPHSTHELTSSDQTSAIQANTNHIASSRLSSTSQSASPGEPTENRPTATGRTDSETPDVTIADASNQADDDSSPTQTARPTFESEVSSAFTEMSGTSAQHEGGSAGTSPSGSPARSSSSFITEEQASGSNAEDIAPGSEPQPTAISSIATGSTATSDGTQLVPLNSLIQDDGQLQSSSHEAFVENSAETLTQTEVHIKSTATRSTLLAPILIGTSTATVNPDGNYVIGTHTLQSTGAPYELQGTTYSLDAPGSALVVNGASTYAVESIRPPSRIPQASTLTLNGVTATLDSASNYIVETQTLKPGGPAITVSGTRISLASDVATVVLGSASSAFSATTGVGDYVWAGIAGILSFASTGASLQPTTPTDETLSIATTGTSFLSSSTERSFMEASQSPFTQAESSSPSTTSSASGDGTLEDEDSLTPSTATNSSNTSASNTDLVSPQQTAASRTDPGTTTQPGPNTSAASSPSSGSIEESSDNDSGRLIIGASYAISILSLVVAIFA